MALIARVCFVPAVLLLAGTAAAAQVSPARSASPTPPAADRADSLREELRQLVTSARDRVFPALVNIRVTTIDHVGGNESKGGGVGSGTIVSPQGHIVTNYHVVAGGHKYKVTLADKQELDATLVGEDPLTDLAVIRIDPAKLASPSAMPVAAWGDSDALQVGDTVMAMGSPYSLSRSVTLGIVSNSERVFSGGEMEIQGRSTGVLTRWIQHDALINPGNSGGPLVNLRGEVVGVNALGGTGMGFAIPSSLATSVVAALVEHGEVPRSYVGVSLSPIEDTGFTEGVLVTSVLDSPPGPAARAGIEAGDLILSIDGKPITARFSEEIPPLQRSIAERPIGSTLTLEYQRDGERRTATISTEKLLSDRGDETGLRAWGVSLEEITPRRARELRLPSTAGVLVTSVRSGSPAALAEPALQRGDVVSAIDGKTVATLAEAIERYRGIMETGEGKQPPEFVLVQFDRRGKDHVTVVEPRAKSDPDPIPETPQAWLGVAVQPVLKDLARKLAGPEAVGFRITRVYPGTRAAESDLRVGDILQQVNTEKLAPRGMQDAGLLFRSLRRLKVDEEATFRVLRAGEPIEVKVKLERTRLEPREAKRDKNRDFGIEVREITFFDRDENQWTPEVTGVLVNDVESAGWAAEGGLYPGDLIQEVAGSPVTDRDSFRRVIADVTKRQPERVPVIVLRGAQAAFLLLEPEWKPTVPDEERPADAGAPRAGDAAAPAAAPAPAERPAPGR